MLLQIHPLHTVFSFCILSFLDTHDNNRVNPIKTLDSTHHTCVGINKFDVWLLVSAMHVLHAFILFINKKQSLKIFQFVYRYTSRHINVSTELIELDISTKGIVDFKKKVKVQNGKWTQL